MGAVSYRKYPEAVKLQIMKSQNPYLFPEFKIPRTTALYWIKKSNRTEILPISEESLMDKQIQFLNQKLRKEKALTALVEKVRAIFPHSFKDRRTPSKNLRRQLIQAIKEAAKFNKIYDCLKLIGLSKSTYSNWLSEFYLCKDAT